MDVLDVPEVHSSRASNWVALFDDFTDRFVGKEREREREKKRVCVLRCARTSAPVILRARDHTHYAHTLHTTAHTGCSLIGWFFCTLLLFVSMIWQQTFAWLKRKALPPWGYSLSHTSLHAPFGLGNFWLCWLLDKLPTAATAAADAAALEQTVCPADKCSHSCSFCTACHCCFCTPPSSLSCCCAVRHWQVMHDFRAIADLSVSDIANKM